MIAYEAGDTVTLSILRDGETMDVQATLTEPEMGDFNDMFENMNPFNFGEGNDEDAPTEEATAQANT